MIIDMIRWYLIIGIGLTALSMISLKVDGKGLRTLPLSKIVRACIQTIIIWPIFVLYVVGLIDFKSHKK